MSPLNFGNMNYNTTPHWGNKAAEGLQEERKASARKYDTPQSLCGKIYLGLGAQKCGHI